MLDPQKTPNILSRSQYEPLKPLNLRGTTFLARDKVNDLLVVIKFWLYNSGSSWKDHELLIREADCLKHLNHPALPKYIETLELENGIAIVQTCIKAISLTEQIKKGRSFSLDEIQELGKQGLEILIYLHQQYPSVIHRNVTPYNVLLGDSSGNSVGKVSLVGFNFVQSVLDSDPKYMTIVAGSNYMPPEQLEGQATIQSDLYSLAATLLFALTGKNFANLSRRSLNNHLNEIPYLSYRWKVWFKTMLNPNPKKRYESAEVALKKLDRVNEPLSDPNPPLTLPNNTQIRISKNSDELKILLEENTIIATLWGNFVAVFIISLFFSPMWLILTHHLSAITFVFLFLVWSLISGTSKKELEINSQEIILNKFIFKSKKTSQLSILLEEITQLQVTQPYWSEDSESGTSKYPATIVIRTGVKEHILPTSNLSNPEIDWIAYEISQWLDISIDREKIPVYKT